MLPTRDELYGYWLRVRYSAWFQDALAFVQTPRGLAMVCGAALLAIVLLVLWRRHRRRLRDHGPRIHKRALQREIRALRRAGDLRAVGERYQRMGRLRSALGVYRRGGHTAEAADLLLTMGRRQQAKRTALEGEAWALYARLCEEDGELLAAAEAYQRDGQEYAAAVCLEQAGETTAAARAYLRAGMEERAMPLLLRGEEPDDAELLETLVRSHLRQRGQRGVDTITRKALRRATRLFTMAGEPERAYRLAVDCEAWDLALPLADELPPSAEMADVFVRAGNPLGAAAVYDRLGDARQAHLQRAEHFLRVEKPDDAARAFEAAEAWDLAAEQWAAARDFPRAAERYLQIGDREQAAVLFELAGDTERAAALRLEMAAEEDDSVAPGSTEPARPKVPPAPPVAAATPIVDTNERYVLESEIGRGGMGVVYRARDLMLERAVAYKHLPLAPGGSTDLLAEARAAARLSHPNIVQVYDAGHGPHGFFIVMELVDGRTFSEHLKKRRLSIAGVIRVGRQVCAALTHAHNRQIIHRDLKPSNLLWAKNERRVKLSDFGLARAFEGTGVETRPAGTPCYMAPEQIQGGVIGPRTDLYSLGCVLYELLLSRPPFQGPGIIGQHLHRVPDDPAATRRNVPTPLAMVVMHCLEKDPARRPPSAAEVGQVLATLT